MTKEDVCFKGKKIGYIETDKKCYVTFKTKDHYFRNFDGFGASMKLLDYLQEKGIDTFIVNYNNEDFYYVDIDTFIIKGHEWLEGDDEQLILNINYWTRYDYFGDNVEVIKYKKECAAVPLNAMEDIGTQDENQKGI